MRLTTTLRIILMTISMMVFAFASTARADTFTALVVGDSISAAYGLRESEGWVAVAQQQLRDKGHDVTFINASISGDTTGGGLRRLPAALERFDPDLLIIELGGNDGLRGYPTNAMQQNIEDMANLAIDSDARVLILGMLIPSNYGQAYLKMFSQAFANAAANTESAFVPFFLEPIAQDRNYFQADGIHPTAEAQPLLAEHVMPAIVDIIETEQSL
ncbi:MAG: arylesterase [Granulosicoccus sp.]